MSCQLDMSRDGFHDHDHGWRMCLSVRPADDLPWRGAL